MNLYIFTDSMPQYRGLWRVLVAAETPEQAIEEFKNHYPEVKIEDFQIKGFLPPIEPGVILSDIMYEPEFS